MLDTTKEIEKVAQITFDAIFHERPSVEIDRKTLLVRNPSKSKMRLVEYDGLTYIERNPHRLSR